MLVCDSSDDDSSGVSGKELSRKRNEPTKIQSLAQMMDDEIVDSVNGNFAS